MNSVPIVHTPACRPTVRNRAMEALVVLSLFFFAVYYYKSGEVRHGQLGLVGALEQLQWLCEAERTDAVNEKSRLLRFDV